MEESKKSGKDLVKKKDGKPLPSLHKSCKGSLSGAITL
jgi:hypothetical protein